MLRQRTVQILSIALFLTLLVWGGYVFVLFAGVDQHFVRLLTQEGIASVTAACGPSELLCRGFQAIGPSLLRSITRSAPLLWYVVFSGVLIAMYLGASRVLGEDSEGKPRLKVWSLPLLFLLSLWLIFSTFAYGDFGDATGALNRLVEPTTAVYPTASQEALTALQTSFTDLQQRGCLSLYGETDSGIRVYDLKGRCIQGTFFTLILPAVLSVAVVLLEFLLLGSLILRLLALRPREEWLDFLVSIGIGAGGFVVLLWLLAVAHLFNHFATVGLLLVVPAVAWKEAQHWWRWSRETTFTFPEMWGGWPLLIGWLLVSLFAFNFLSVVRPFPIGWDDLGSYLNRAHMLAGYQHFLPMMSPFQWEYVTALGFAVFGAESVFGAVVAMQFNWMAGVLAVAGMIGFTHVLLGRRGGLLSGLLYYSLPLVGHFSFADMKIDNAVFAMMSISAICFLQAVLPPGEEDGEPQPSENWRLQWLLLAGVLSGFAFSFKTTSLMLTFGLLVVLSGVRLSWLAAVAAVWVMIGLYFQQGVLNASAFFTRFLGTPVEVSQTVTALSCFGIAAVFALGASYVRPRLWKVYAKELLVFVGGAAVVVVPWVVHNNIYSGTFPPQLMFSAPNLMAPVVTPDRSVVPRPGATFRTLPEELALDMNHAACKATSRIEELDRYWGNESGPSHYLTLPWRTMLNLDSGGYYVTTTPLLALFPLLLLLPVFWQRGQGRRLRWLVLLTGVIVVEWVLVANGVPWYGLAMFVGLCAGLEALITHAPDKPTKWLTGILMALSLILLLGFRMWQFEEQNNSLEFAIGKVSADVVYARTVPNYQHVRDVVTERRTTIPGRPYTYRMGTFIPYFIPESVEVLPLSDNQLDMFNCLHQEGDPALTTKRLKALGFNGLIFDTNTASIERDPNGTLHQKVKRFIDYVSNPSSGVVPDVLDQSTGIAYFLIP